MNPNFEKDNPLTIDLAVKSRSAISLSVTPMEVKLCHALYQRHPDAIEESKILFVSLEENTIEQFNSVVHDLERRGILRVDVLGKERLFTLTRDFYAVMSHL